ncbi:hypothetical protein QYF36_000620 [Acer negundo]|nr:hypothetical protein QYF36_000620 [Acer negundo]
MKSVADEEVKKEETEEKVKETEDVPFDALLLYNELKPYVPPITFSSQPKQEEATTILLYGEIVDTIVSHELSNDFSSVADEEVEKEETNMLVLENFFQDIITYRRKFETLEFG